MSAQVIALAAKRVERGIELPVVIRLTDTVRRRTGLAEGHVLAFRGSGTPGDPVEALVQWSGFNEYVPVLFLELAPE